jgi:lipoprotein-releasing system ATP-binding protein
MEHNRETDGSGMIDGQAVYLEKVRKVYRSGDSELTVLDDLDLRVPKGTVTAVMGRSGSGKTTLLNLIGGLDRATSGRIVVHGADIETCSEEALSELRNRYIGFVFQFHNLLSEFSAVENVMMPSLISRYEPVSAFRRAAALLGDLELSDRLHAKPNRLSGGESQRVSIARALINDPEIVLADEPTGNLDTVTADRIKAVLYRIVRTHGRTLLIVTHNPSMIEDADQCYRLERGTLIPLIRSAN